MSSIIEVPVAVAEVVDKITILRIKARLISDQEKRRNVKNELAILEGALRAAHPHIEDDLRDVWDDLQQVNQELWDIEDDIRGHEGRKDFGQSFIELARAVYVTNDRRAALKRQINLALGSAIVEEKSYQAY